MITTYEVGSSVVFGAFVKKAARKLTFFGVWLGLFLSIVSSWGSCDPPPTGLVSWWPGNGSANDVIGTNNGVFTGPQFAAGEVGQAFDLVGTNNIFIQFSPSLDVGQGPGFTIEAWINPGTLSSGRPIFEWAVPSAYAVHFWMNADTPGALYADIVDANGNSHIIQTASGVLTTNLYQHVAVTYDKASGVAQLLVNGALLTSSALGSFTPRTGTGAYIGYRPSTTPFGPINFTGLIDEVSLYNRALSVAEIQAIYSAGSAGKCTAPSGSCDPPPTGLVSWWPGNGNANDIIGVNNGVFTGPLFAAGEVGQAFDLIGTNNVFIPASPSLDVGQAPGFTIEAWINPGTLSGGGRPIFEWAVPSAYAVHFWMNADTPGALYADIVDANGNSHIIQTASGALTTNLYQHVAVTYDKASGVAQLLVNGVVLTNSTLGSFTPRTGTGAYIGYRPSTTPFGPINFIGLIDEVSLYNRALSVAEIQAIYSAGSAGKCAASSGSCDPPPTGLVSWWPGNGNANDIIGANNGVFTGPLFAAGEVGQAFDLIGTNNIFIPASPSLDVGQASGFTIEAWINPGTLSGGGRPIFEWAVPGAYAVHFWVNADSPGALYANIVDTTGNIHIIQTASGVLTTNLYQHVAVTYDKASGVAQLLVNGVVLTNSTLGTYTPRTGTGAYIGYRPSTTPFGPISFIGLIDEVSLYNRALLNSEIQAIYLAGSAGKCTVPTPPRILGQPSGQIVPVGATVILSAGVSGTSPLSYQWRFNGTNLPAATNGSLLLTNVQPGNTGNYSLFVTNAYGSALSSNALLQVRVLFAYGNAAPLTNASYSFPGSAQLALSNAYPNGSIFFTLDGGQPTFSSTAYTGPFVTSNSVVLRALGYSADFSESGQLGPIAIGIIPYYTLSRVAGGGGTITVSPATGPYLSNSVVTVTAIPASGWTFLQWLGDALGANPTASITMIRNKTVQAVFGTTLSTTAAGGGSVHLNPPGGVYPYGATVWLTAVPQPGNYFGIWGNAASGSVNPLSFVVTNPKPTVSSLFSALGTAQAALTVVPVGGGQVSLTPQANAYNLGQNVSISATPAQGQAFTGWTGDASGTQNPLQVSVTTNKVIYANFSQDPVLIIQAPYDGLSLAGFQLTVSGAYGAHYQINASSDFLSWTALGVVTNAAGSVQFNDPAATNHLDRFYRAQVVP